MSKEKKERTEKLNPVIAGAIDEDKKDVKESVDENNDENNDVNEDRSSEDAAESKDTAPFNLAELKDTYGDLRVIEVAEKPYIFRVIKNAEYSKLLESGQIDATSEENINSSITRLALVYPKYDTIDLDNEVPGLDYQLKSTALEIHGFTPQKITAI